MAPDNDMDTDTDGWTTETDDTMSMLSSINSSFHDDERSVLSFHSSVNGYLWREVHGRGLNTMNEIYMMPADGEEHGRHGLQHKALTLALNSLYFGYGRVQRALAPRDHSTPAIIDIGCGSGSWPMDMAREFPHAEVVGLDLVPPTNLGAIPDNCRFEVDDANLPLPHYTGCFDVVHCRALESGIQDYQSLLYNIAQILRPNGVVLLAAGDLQLYDHHGKPLARVEEGQPGFTFVQRCFSAIYQSLTNLGVASSNARDLWPDWLAKNPNYTETETVDLYIPIGPWPHGLDQRLTLMSDLMRKDVIGLCHACRPMMIQDGYPERSVDHWLAGLEQELQEPRLKALAKWRFTAATRTVHAWIPRPPPDEPAKP